MEHGSRRNKHRLNRDFIGGFMKYKLARKVFQIYKNDIYILPTFRLYLDNHMYVDKNFSIEFHFIVFHIRLLFMNEK